MVEYFLIAEVKSLSGNFGFVSLDLYSDFPERFFNLDHVYIDIFGVRKKISIEDVEINNNEVSVKFLNFDSADDVKALLGCKLYVCGDEVVKLGKDTYFIHDLIGMKVYNEGELLGEIINVLQLSSNDIYVVKDVDENEHLIPAVKDYVKKIDIGSGRVDLINYDGSLSENEN